MADTVLRHLSTVEKYLLSSTRFWPLLSTAAVSGAVSSFYSTQQLNNSGKYIISATIFFHLFIFFSNPRTLKHTFAPFFLGPAKKWAIRITAMKAGYLLHFVPGRSEMGLVFVICVWVDAVAIGRIIRPSVDLWVVNAVFMAVIGRGIDLYGFWGNWLVMVLCFPLIYIRVRLNGYKTDEIEEKAG